MYLKARNLMLIDCKKPLDIKGFSLSPIRTIVPNKQEEIPNGISSFVSCSAREGTRTIKSDSPVDCRSPPAGWRRNLYLRIAQMQTSPFRNLSMTNQLPIQLATIPQSKIKDFCQLPLHKGAFLHSAIYVFI